MVCLREGRPSGALRRTGAAGSSCRSCSGGRRRRRPKPCGSRFSRPQPVDFQCGHAAPALDGARFDAISRSVSHPASPRASTHALRAETHGRCSEPEQSHAEPAHPPRCRPRGRLLAVVGAVHQDRADARVARRGAPTPTPRPPRHPRARPLRRAPMTRRTSSARRRRARARAGHAVRLAAKRPRAAALVSVHRRREPRPRAPSPRRIAQRTERAYWYLRKLFGFTPRFRLLVLDRATTGRGTPRSPTYGIAHFTRRRPPRRRQRAGRRVARRQPRARAPPAGRRRCARWSRSHGARSASIRTRRTWPAWPRR